VRELKAKWDAPRTPYFRALTDGSFERDDFVATQIQFLDAVAHFAKPMEILAGRVSVADRQSLIDNIADEHGHGDAAASHEETFLELLGRLGAPRSVVSSRRRGPEVIAFNAALDGVCAKGDPFTAVATLAVIEDIFAGLSTLIGQSIVHRGWLTKSDVVHYATHEVLDVHHSDSFYAIVEPRFAEHRTAIAAGLELGGYIFLRMYDDLYRARERR
jgi:hypothetical protein